MPPNDSDVQERITTFWSTVAPFYNADPCNVPSLDSAEYQAWIRAIERLLPTPPADVLDIGTGTGFVALIASLGYSVTAFDSIHIAGNLEEAQEGREGSKGKALQGGGIPVSPHSPRSSRPHRSGPAGPDGPPGATGASGLSGGQIWSANFQLPASIASASFSNQVVALPAAARHRKPTGTSQAWNSTRWLSN